jgi:hypothetical protein
MDWWVVTIRNFELALAIKLVTLSNVYRSPATYMIVVLTMKFYPGILDSRKRGSSVAIRVAVGDWLRSPLCGVEDTWIGEIEVLGLRNGPLSKAITGVRCNHGKHISPDVPTAKGIQAPTRLLVVMG